MKKAFATAVCFPGWFAIVTQFVLMIQNRQAGIPETIIRFFSFFTILTNILVAIFFTVKVFGLSGKTLRILTRGEPSLHLPFSYSWWALSIR